MHLTKKEQAMLDGEMGEACQQSMEILVALGKIYKAEGMVQISSAQIAGVSYKTIGEAGLAYIKEMAEKGAKVSVPSFLNPAGMDMLQWKEMGIPGGFAEKQMELLEAYRKMGAAMTCTCTPYLAGFRPKYNEHVAWSESSAISFANSVLGARTNREGGPSALASAICGVTPNYGLHLDENRVCSLVVDVQCEVGTKAKIGALGAFVGENAKGRNPAFLGIRRMGEDGLKALGAAMAAFGSVALYNIKGITPDWNVADRPEKVQFGKEELKHYMEKLGESSRKASKPDIVAIGCPHASLDEIKEAARLLAGKKAKCPIWVCTARKIKEEADRLGYTRKIEKAGGRVVADTCMVVCPLEEMGFKTTASNSAKAAKYLPSMCKQNVIYGDLGDIVYAGKSKKHK